ncbi:hypothetical protein [Rhodococcus koreensis]
MTIIALNTVVICAGGDLEPGGRLRRITFPATLSGELEMNSATHTSINIANSD